MQGVEAETELQHEGQQERAGADAETEEQPAGDARLERPKRSSRRSSSGARTRHACRT